MLFSWNTLFSCAKSAQHFVLLYQECSVGAMMPDLQLRGALWSIASRVLSGAIKPEVQLRVWTDASGFLAHRVATKRRDVCNSVGQFWVMLHLDIRDSAAGDAVASMIKRA